MRIDNSQANAFWFCPRKYQEVNLVGIQKAPSGDARDFGKLVHERLKRHFLELRGDSYELPPPEPTLDPAVILEADEMYEAYAAHYPMEDFDVLEVEKLFEVTLPASPLTGIVHTYTGKRDAVVRSYHTGRLRLLEHKSETRGSKNNLPEVWAARSQVALYLYAGGIAFGETFDDIILDVLTRRSPAGRFGPGFRRDHLQRTKAQIAQAVTDITYVADQITLLREKLGDEAAWPGHNENCNKWGYKCDFYQIHINEEGQHNDATIKKYYVPTERYLEL